MALSMAFLAGQASCKKEDCVKPAQTAPQPVNKTVTVKYTVDTDFPYNILTYRDVRGVNKEDLRKAHWEKTFTAHTGDSLQLDVHILTSNMRGSYMHTKIAVDGKVLKTRSIDLNCTEEGCPIGNKELDLKLAHRID